MSCADNGITRSAALCNTTWVDPGDNPAIARTASGRPRTRRSVRNDATAVTFPQCTKRDASRRNAPRSPAGRRVRLRGFQARRGTLRGCMTVHCSTIPARRMGRAPGTGYSFFSFLPSSLGAGRGAGGRTTSGRLSGGRASGRGASVSGRTAGWASSRSAGRPVPLVSEGRSGWRGWATGETGRGG
jgi:hypothetical protein